MKKDVLINIRGTVTPEGAPPDVIELVTEGRYYNRNGSYYITYREFEPAGYGVTTTLKVDGEKSVTLIRNGRLRSRLLLEKGRRHLSHYDTGYGQMLVGISGCKIRSQLGEFGGELSFLYTIDVNSSIVSQNEVFISVKEANNVQSDEHGHAGN